MICFLNKDSRLVAPLYGFFEAIIPDKLIKKSSLFDFVVIFKKMKVKNPIQTLKATDVDVEPLCLS